MGNLKKILSGLAVASMAVNPMAAQADDNKNETDDQQLATKYTQTVKDTQEVKDSLGNLYHYEDTYRPLSEKRAIALDEKYDRESEVLDALMQNEDKIHQVFVSQLDGQSFASLPESQQTQTVKDLTQGLSDQLSLSQFYVLHYSCYENNRVLNNENSSKEQKSVAKDKLTLSKADQKTIDNFKSLQLRRKAEIQSGKCPTSIDSVAYLENINKALVIANEMRPAPKATMFKFNRNSR